MSHKTFYEKNMKLYYFLEEIVIILKKEKQKTTGREKEKVS